MNRSALAKVLPTEDKPFERAALHVVEKSQAKREDFPTFRVTQSLDRELANGNMPA